MISFDSVARVAIVHTQIMEMCFMNLSFASVQGDLQIKVEILGDATFLWLSLSQGNTLTSLTLIYSLKPPINWPKLYTDFTALPRRWFLYRLASVLLFQWRRNPTGSVTAPVKVPSLIFTLFCFLCPFDLKMKSEIQKWAKCSFSSCCAWDVAISSNLLANWVIHSHQLFSDSLRYWMDFAGVIVPFPCKKYTQDTPQSKKNFFDTY